MTRKKARWKKHTANIIVYIGFLLEICHAVSIETRPWAVPCGRDTESTTVPFNMNTQLDQTTRSDDLIQNVSSSLAELRTLLHDQSESYKSLDQSVLPVFGVDSYLKLEGLPVPAAGDNGNVSIENLQTSANEDYLTLSIFWVFIEQANFDSQIEDSVNMTEIITNYGKIIETLKETLCKLTHILSTQNNHVEQVTRDVMPDTLRDIAGTTNKILRDIMVVKGFKHTVDNLARKYRSLGEMLM